MRGFICPLNHKNGSDLHYSYGRTDPHEHSPHTVRISTAVEGPTAAASRQETAPDLAHVMA